MGIERMSYYGITFPIKKYHCFINLNQDFNLSYFYEILYSDLCSILFNPVKKVCRSFIPLLLMFCGCANVFKERQQKFREKNPEYIKQWRQQNREKYNAYMREYRAKKKKEP